MARRINNDPRSPAPAILSTLQDEAKEPSQLGLSRPSFARSAPNPFQRRPETPALIGELRVGPSGKSMCISVNSLITNLGQAARIHPSHETRSARKHWRALHDLHGPRPPERHFWHMPPHSHPVVFPTRPLPTGADYPHAPQNPLRTCPEIIESTFGRVKYGFTTL
jgi:hypothetical protein